MGEKKIYFDNSAMGSLYIKRNQVNIEKLIYDFEIYISAINIAELINYKNIKARNNLLKFYNKINAKDYYPLNFPAIILKETYLAIINKRKSNISDENYGKKLLGFLKYPEEITLSDVEGFRKYSSENKKLFIDQKEKMRNTVDFTKFGYKLKKVDPIFFLNIVISDRELMNLIFSEMMSILEIKNYDPEGGVNFIPNYEPWLLSIGFRILEAIFFFQGKASPGSLDISQIVYLCAADYFVTEDDKLYNLIKVFLESDLMINKKYVMKFKEFIKFFKLEEE